MGKTHALHSSLLDLHSNHLAIVVGLHLMLVWCFADSWHVLLSDNTIESNCYAILLPNSPPRALLALQPCSKTSIKPYEY